MAKTETSVEALIQLRKKSDGVWEARVVSYGGPKDTVDSEITYDNLHSWDVRDLLSGELSGTLQTFLDSCDSDYKTANGIV